MIRTLLLTTAASGALFANAQAQTRDPVKIRATYERLCTGDGPGSAATCEVLRRDMDEAGQPGTQGWTGLQIGRGDDGVAGAYIYSVAPNGPAARMGLRTGDRVITVEGQAVNDDKTLLAALKGAGIGRRVRLTVVRGTEIQDVSLVLGAPPVAAPTLNATRTDRGSYSLWSGASVTVDPVRLGEIFHGVLEDSDASSDWGKREDCVQVMDSGPGKNLQARIEPNGAPMSVWVQHDRCGPGLASSGSAYQHDGKTPFALNLATVAGRKTFLYVSGKASAKPYQVIVREQTAKETVAWREALRQSQIAAQQQREAEARAAQDRSAMWGAAFTGLVAGVTGTEIPAMREDGSMPNMLDTLNAVNATLERKNAEGAARLNATIAAAQAQGEQQRREAADRERREAESRRMAQQSRQEQDRKTVTTVLGTSRAQWEQGLREAIASGDKTKQQYFIGRIRENQQAAQENGIGAEVTQYANAAAPRQGQLGQTPPGPFPSPTLVPLGGKPASAPGAQPSQNIAEAKLRCFKGSDNPTRQWQESDCTPPPPPKGAGADGRTGTGGGSSGEKVAGGQGGRPGTPGGTPGLPGGPGSPRPPGSTSPGQQPPPSGGKIDERIWWESVTLCELDANNGQSKFGNWTCRGSLQMNYVNFEKPNWQHALMLTCGTDRPLRDLGTAGGYRAFGCGHPLSPTSTDDIPKRYGVSYVPGRISYRCPTGRQSCRPA